MSATTGLVLYDDACRAIAAARDVDEVKTIADKAAALRVYARQSKNPELELMAAEIRVRATHRMGELSAALEKAPPGPAKDTSRRREVTTKTATLRAAGISTSQAHRAEQLATVPESQLDDYIEKCRKAGKAASTEEVVKRVSKTVARKAKIETLVAKNKPLETGARYNVIYADPPWQYRNVVSEDRRLENHYPTMPLPEIMALPVRELAHDDALLFLWATITELPGALNVMGSWGFEYRSHCVWVKPSIGIGFWYRSQHELLLLGVRGNMPTPIEAARRPSVIEAPKGKHSEKPAIFRQMIDESYGDLPRIELFARDAASGWASWGNQSAA